MRTRLFLFLLFAVVAVFSNVAVAEDIAHGVRVVVIDAGHGGYDPGARYGGISEKDLTLKMALRLGKLIEEQMPGVKVVYTRKTDKALANNKAEDLQARANIANKAGGDLFISIHANAAKSTAARGVETLIMGESSKEQRYNENALFENNRDDLIDMSDERAAAIVRAYIQNLQFTYGEYSEAMARCLQNNYIKNGRHSRGVKAQLLRVLYATDMPGVLTEIGFLSNTQELAYLKSERGQEEIARSLFRAVKDYSSYVLGSRQADEQQIAVTAPKPEPKPMSAPAIKVAEEPTTARAKESVAKPVKDSTAEKKPVVQPQTTSEQKNPTVESQPLAEKSSAAEVKTSPNNNTAPSSYAIQVLAATKRVPLNSLEFKSYKNKAKEYLSEGGFSHKYCLYESTDKAEVLRRLAEVRKVFSGAFLVRCQGDRIVK